MRLGNGKPRLRLWLCDDSGSVAIETSLVLVTAMIMMLGLVEVCFLAFNLAVLNAAAKQGVRYAASHGADSSLCSGPSPGCTDTTGANVVSAVNTYLSGYLQNTSGISVQVSYPDNSSSPLSRVAVSVTYVYHPLFGFPGMANTFYLGSEGSIVY
jgi:Flp pilus assembly protein TadG